MTGDGIGVAPRHHPSRRGAPGADDAGMRYRRALAALLVAFSLALGACATAGPAPTTAPPAGEQPGGPAAVLDQAREVASQLDQREADLESMIP
jgi:hypothetical protein